MSPTPSLLLVVSYLVTHPPCIGFNSLCSCHTIHCPLYLHNATLYFIKAGFLGAFLLTAVSDHAGRDYFFFFEFARYPHVQKQEHDHNCTCHSKSKCPVSHGIQTTTTTTKTQRSALDPVHVFYSNTIDFGLVR